MPTVVDHNGVIYLYGRDKNVYRSDNLLGPFEKIGQITFNDRTPLNSEVDTMIFSNDDDGLYIIQLLSMKITGIKT